MKKNISAVILAGGKSSRMGSDKGLLVFNGMAMIEHVISNVAPCVDDVLVVSSNREYKMHRFPVFDDVYKNCGPLGGIHAGLTNSKSPWNLVVACDMPYLTTEFFRFLIANISGSKPLIPVHEAGVEPLCAIYPQSSLNEIELLLEKGEYKMQNVIKLLKAELIRVPEEIFGPSVLFNNLNCPEDLSSHQVH